MSFRRALEATSVRDTRARRWIFVPYDQLSSEIGPLSREEPRDVGVVLIENPAKAARRPYHVQKLATVLANLRCFALEQARRGVAVRHVVATSSYADTLTRLAREIGPMRVMRPAERELRTELAALLANGALEEIPHEGWLTTSRDFEESQKGPPWRLDAFYRHVRRRLGVLMDGDGPVGGRFSFDHENRHPWPGEPPAPTPPSFEANEIKDEVITLVKERFGHHPGTLRPELIAATQSDAARMWAWAKQECLPWFGPFEDAMSVRSRGLFHSRISPLLNLSRLTARRVLGETLALDVPLPSQEGFIRQILGWREYMRHVHEATDGFRRMEGRSVRTLDAPGDGGFHRWRGVPWHAHVERATGVAHEALSGAGGSDESILRARGGVPPAYWGRPSGLRCLDEVVAHVWDEGWSHHITRLMVLSNIAALLDVSPRELTDWFWIAYVDAYDWVVEPNVHAMATFGVGPIATTKPYVAGARYIDRMSDFCKGCRFHPNTTCPLTPMYWAYLNRHERPLARIGRLRLPLAAAARRTESQKTYDSRVFERTRATLMAGSELPTDLTTQCRRAGA